MAIRCKFQVMEITENHYNNMANPPAKRVKLEARYEDKIPEDQRFYSSTPSGSLDFVTNNPLALAELTLGRSFYIDLTPAE